jgi:hypothetical protein
MVDKLFGDFLVRYKEPVEVEKLPPKSPAAGSDLQFDEDAEPELPPPYEFVPVSEAIRAQYVILFFTAEYMPPKCHEIMTPLIEMASKGNDGSGTVKKFQVVVVNCDSKEASYRTCI